jgi:hypothetical protein
VPEGYALASRVSVSAEHQAEVAERDVAEAAHEQQVQDDAAEPRGNEVAADARRDEDDEARNDLDNADDVHRVRGGAGDQAVELARQVARPVVGQDVRELVQAEQDRRDRERDPQQGERLGGGVVAQVVRAGQRDGSQGGGDGAHGRGSSSEEVV